MNNIVVVGAGNIGLSLVSYISIYKKCSITLFTNKKIEKLKLLEVDKGTEQWTPRINVTNNPEVLSKANYILCTYPAFLRKEFIENYGQYITKSTKLGFIPGYGGTEFFCKNLIEKGIVIFGLQRVPYVSRADSNKATIFSKKKELYLSTIPSKYAKEVSRDMSNFLDITSIPLKNYLAVTLTPTNPIIHIAGLWGAFRNYDNNKGYQGKLGFYDQWDDETSKILFEYDHEVQSICNHLKSFDLSEVISLPTYYESKTPRDLTKKLKSIESFKIVKVPIKSEQGKLVIELENRMFSEDFPYGIVIYKDIARLLHLKTPTIDSLLRFYEFLSGVRYDFWKNSESLNHTGAPSINGLDTIDKLINFYK